MQPELTPIHIFFALFVVIISIIQWLYATRKCKDPIKTGFYQCEFFFNQIKIKGENMNVKLTATQKVPATTPKPVDQKGNTAEIEAGTMRYRSTDESVFTVSKNEENEFGFEVVAQGPGVGQVIASADADLGEGVKEIEGTVLTVEVVAGMAVGFGEATVGEVTEQEL